jgi:hypothetical protein
MYSFTRAQGADGGPTRGEELEGHSGKTNSAYAHGCTDGGATEEGRRRWDRFDEKNKRRTVVQSDGDESDDAFEALFEWSSSASSPTLRFFP